MKKGLLRIFIPLAIVYGAAFAFFDHAMHQPPEQFSSLMMHVGPVPFLFFPFETMWKQARAGDLQISDPAPDFTLPLLDHSQSVTLSNFRGQQPVVLIFGSYTWPPFRREVPALNKLYQQYRDRAAFYVVYIDEAHPSNLWQMQSNVKEGVVFQNPATSAEREQVASSCVRKLHIAMPALIDSMENRVEKDYTGWPDRLYLIDITGRIAYKSAAGPFGFNPRSLAKALSDFSGKSI